MPTYGYSCQACGHQFDRFLRIDDRGVPVELPCPECKVVGSVQMELNAIGFTLDVLPKVSSDYRNLLGNIKKKNSSYWTKSTINDTGEL